MQLLWQTMRDFIEDDAPSRDESQPARMVFVGIPAADLADELGLVLLSHLMPSNVSLNVLSVNLLVSEKIALVAEQRPAGLVISAFGPGDEPHVRYLCKRIRQNYPRLPIIVAYWQFHGDLPRLTERFAQRGADQLVTTCRAAIDRIDRIPALPASA
jgi:hypothetical protein